MAGVGSVLLLPEVLAKPMRDGSVEEVAALAGLLGRLDLRSVDPVTAEVATTLASGYRLRAADAVHLATAVVVGADRFITNNRRDFPVSISEIKVSTPTIWTSPEPSAPGRPALPLIFTPRTAASLTARS